MLTDEHKTKRMGSALKFLTCYAQEGDEFLDSIVTGDETWVFHHTPESKQQSLQWRHMHSPRIKNFKSSISVEKTMASVFWDRKGIILVDFVPPGTTVNAAAYCDTVTWFDEPFKTKRGGCHVACACSITTRGPIPPYSQDLVLSDFHLFLHLKKRLTGKKFDDDEVQK